MHAHVPWLRSYVDFSATTQELSDRLTIAGIEIDAIQSIGAFDPFSVVGVVRENEPLEGSDHLRTLQIDVADERGNAQIVTGAPNAVDFVDGTRVAVALPGATLISPDGPSGGTWVVKNAKLMGVKSFGVLCSEMELGISEENEGVMMLDKGDAGDPLSNFVDAANVGVAGHVLNIAILPNIARCQSMRGLAAEVASLYDQPLNFDAPLEPMEITSGDLDPDVVPECIRFSVAVIDNVEVKPSPWWVQARLLASGIVPKNNIVDASNYVLLELGQPTHAYDAAKLTSEKLDCRFAKEGEEFVPLGQGDDPKPMKLPAQVLTITNDDKVVSVAGVIGGAETAVSDSTTRLVLESANFDYLTVRRGQRLIDTFTDASQRFGRGVDPTLPPQGIQRIVHILRETCPNLTIEATAESGQTEFPKTELSLDIAVMNQALGTSFDSERATTLLERVGFTVAGDDVLNVTVPNARLDIEIIEDLYEEVARLDGYDRLPETIPSEPVPNYAGNRHLFARRKIEDFLASEGLQQVISYTLTAPELEAKARLGDDEPQYMELLNPMTVDKRVLRRSLVPRLLQIMSENQRQVAHTHLFEQGIVVHPEGEGISPGLPAEPWHLAIAMQGPVEDHGPHLAPRDADFFDLKRVLDNLLKHLRVDAVITRGEGESGIFHPGIFAQLEGASSNVIGRAGQLHPKIAEAFELENVFCAEIDLDALIAASSFEEFLVPAPPRLPAIEIDVSLLLDRSLAAGEVIGSIESSGGDTLESAVVFDYYVGDNVDADKMALGVRLRFRDSERTLTMDEATAARDEIVAGLESKYSAQLR